MGPTVAEVEGRVRLRLSLFLMNILMYNVYDRERAAADLGPLIEIAPEQKDTSVPSGDLAKRKEAG